MALVRFDQDPEMPDGTGMFHADDGSSMYAHDPEMAGQLAGTTKFTSSALDPSIIDAATAGPDERLAGIGGVPPTEARLAAGGQEAPGVAPPVTTDASAGGWKLDQSRMGKPAEENPTVKAALSAERGPAQAAPAQPESPALGQANELQTNVDKYAMRPVYQAPTRGGVRPVTQQETVERSGMPYDPNGPEAMARADASINKNLAYSEQQRALAARAAGEAAAYQAALPQVQEEARIAQLRRDMQERQYRRDRDDLDKAIEESDKSARSFNANRWFEDRGAVGQIGAAIAQAFGAYASALTGGPNVVLNQINSYIDRDIANQRAQIEAGKAGADNALARLNRQFGNLDQAEAALKIAQQKKAETMAQAYAASTKNEDIMKQLDVWLADNNERRVQAEQQFQNNAYGKVSTQTAAKVIAPSAGGMREPTEAEKTQRYGTLEKRNAVIGGTYEGEIKRQKAMGIDTEKAEKQKPLVIENLDGSLVEARSTPEATKIREMRALQLSADATSKELEKLSSVGEALSPAAQKKYLANLEATVNSANTLFGQGVVRGEDMDRYRKQILGDQYGIGAAAAASELRGIINNAYQARVDSQRGAGITESFGTGGTKVNYTGNASKNPTAKTMFRQVGQ